MFGVMTMFSKSVKRKVIMSKHHDSGVSSGAIAIQLDYRKCFKEKVRGQRCSPNGYPSAIANFFGELFSSST